MRNALIFLLMAWPAYAVSNLAIGTGFESRVSRDVNPDFISNMGFGEIYASLTFHPWVAMFELEMAQSNDNLGNYSVQNTYLTGMAWGRFEPWTDIGKVLPYMGFGLGWQLNNTVSHFGSARDEGWNDGGGIVGLALGASAVFFDHWNVEAEARASKFELSNEPTWGFLLRTGYAF